MPEGSYPYKIPEPDEKLVPVGWKLPACEILPEGMPSHEQQPHVSANGNDAILEPTPDLDRIINERIGVIDALIPLPLPKQLT